MDKQKLFYFISGLVPKPYDTLFYISNTFFSNDGLKLGKSQQIAKQQPKAALLLSESYSLSSSMLTSKNNTTYSKKCTSNKFV